MQIVGDTSADVFPGQLDGLNVQLVPLSFTLDGKVYRSGIDVDSDGFYRLIAETPSFPTTSQPSVGDFVEVYHRLAATDPDILSIHISSALSGTYNSAAAAARLVPEAHVTLYDSKTVSGPLGWQLEAAARAAKAGWDTQRILALLQKMTIETSFVFTVPSLRYLIHGGRISHLKGLLGIALGIKPLIGIDSQTGMLTQAAQARTMKQALEMIVALMGKKHAPGSALRVQVLHGNNPEAAATLRTLVDKQFKCTWMPTEAIAPVLGAHTGPGLTGAFYGPMDLFREVPGNPW